MKKFLVAVVSVLLIAVFAVTMTGCDKSGSIKKAFEKEGYTISESLVKDSAVLTATLSGLDEEDREEMQEYGVITCKKGLKSVVIIKFPSSDKIKEILGDNKYSDAEKNGYVNGNCWLAIPLDKDANEIFKNA
ncbi:MAG: hypothetical protein K2L12_07620 [Clostridia bacterium]|nr:hypothetical protein [Clostridia bacterium]